MSTIALSKLLEYIMTLSLTDKNKDWLAGKIIESKKNEDNDAEREARLYSLFGAWASDPEMDSIEKAITEGRTSGQTRSIQPAPFPYTISRVSNCAPATRKMSTSSTGRR